MTPEQYERAGDVFDAALAVAPADRAAFVADACGRDYDLRREVESLLAAHGEALGFIERPAMEVVAALISGGVPIPPGTRIGRYEVLSPIGQGGMGEVYRARDVSLGRDVALKLPRQLYSAGSEAVRRFEQEARAASSLNHPNIITVHEIGDAGGRRFIAMELVDGHALSSMIGSLTATRLAHIGRQIAQALAVAHDAGIVHGDIKPENVMVRGDGYVKVLDFGVARLAATAVDEHPTQPTALDAVPIFGTPRYMAPEQASGEPAAAASDVFACGVLLHELATGRQLEPEEFGSGLPPALEDLLRRMLDPRPSARPSAREVEATLSRIATPGPDGLAMRRDRLPAQRTALVGRATELSALEEMLLVRAVRLTTLTGAGGTGKTRLALEAAARLAPHFAGGASFVSLAPVADVSGVVPAIAHGYGVSESDGTLGDALAAHLGRLGPVLLVLDNFEHVVTAAGLVQDLLDRCPELTVVVTSRVVLHLYGEQEFRVAPLALPDVDTAPPDQLIAASAIELFVQRATAGRPDFVLTAANGRAVAEICRRVDGLPLAIELAAARVKILPPADLLARLDRRLELLTGGPRDLPPRQRTLRSTVDWSHGLLSAAEQRLFRRMSVFAGGCSLEGVEAVCDATEDLGIDVLSGVTALVDNSLMVQRASDDGQSRFVMLETIREYARERLDESGETAATLHAHAAYALVIAEEGSRGTPQQDDDAWLRSCDLEHDNLRAAMSHLVTTGHGWGLRLGVALFRFWEHREHFSEGREYLGAVLASPAAGAAPRLRAQALYSRGVLCYSQRDFAAAAALHREALELFRALGDARGEAITKGALAWQIVQLRGNHAEALALVEEAAAIWERFGDVVVADQTHSNLASVAQAAGNPSLARALLQRVAERSEKRGDIRMLATALNGLGDVAAACGEPQDARRHHQDSLTRYRQIDDRAGIARTLADLADLDVKAGDVAAATASLTDSLRAFDRAGQQRGVARELETLAWCLSQLSQHASAVTCASAAAAIRERIRVPTAAAEHARTERTLADARQQLTVAEYERAWSAGLTMPVAQLAALAVGT